MSCKSIRRVDRKNASIARLIAIAFIFYGSFVAAELHLGELKMLSAAGEPLHAEITLGQTNASIEEGAIDVNLASDSMFERAGLTRDIYLASLELSLAVNSDLWVVEITANEPLDRPYVDFLIQLDLPDGRKVREYRILRNPYLVVDQAPRQAFELNTVSKAGVLTEEAQPRVYKHRVVVGDTLWNVAKRLRPSHMTMAETMDHLYATNPEAFLDGDSTKLRKGFVVSFTLASALEEEPAVENLDTRSSITETSKQLIPIVQSQLDTSLPSQELIELADFEVQREPQPVSEQVEIASQQEMPAVTEAPPAPKEQIELQPESSKEMPDLSVAELLQTSDPDKGLQLIEQPEEQVTAVAKLTDVVQLKDFFSMESEQFNHWLTRLQQLPKDLLVIALVFLLAILVNWRRKSGNADELGSDDSVDSLLDGPFASSHDDDVFDQQNTDSEVQSHHDTEVPESEDYLIDDFVDDNIDLDPLKVRLDMAALCIEMGDMENAREVLEEVISEADSEGKAKARALLDRIKT